MVLRLTGTLAYMAWAMALAAPSSSGIDGLTDSLEPKTIDTTFMTAAIHLWREYFWPHARAALRQIGLNDRHKDERRVLRWVKEQGRPTFHGKKSAGTPWGKSLTPNKRRSC
jgi:hypothetical protein